MNQLIAIADSTGRFWEMADALQERTVSHAQGLFEFAERASPRQLMDLLVQYRFFTIYCIADIAILVARMRDGRLRSFLAEIVSDELGNGDPQLAHPCLYDDFLRSLGVPLTCLDGVGLPSNIAMLNRVRKTLLEQDCSMAYGVGLRGMGGACVGRLYLSRLYRHFVKNPYIQSGRQDIDWRFWELHVGDHDVDHRRRTRELINDEIVGRCSSDLQELERGYRESMGSWRAFWSNILEASKAGGSVAMGAAA
jgi:heme oxygenase-like protein